MGFYKRGTVETLTADLVEASFLNCIIDGNRSIELGLLAESSTIFNYTFLNCTLKFNHTNGLFNDDPLYNFDNTSLYQSILLNGAVNFLDTSKNQFELHENPEAIDQGYIDTALGVPFDFFGSDRTQSADIGAFEFISQN